MPKNFSSGQNGYDCLYNVTEALGDKNVENSTAIYNHIQNNIQISNISFENLYLLTGINTEWYHYVSNRTEDKGGLNSESNFGPILKKCTELLFLNFSLFYWMKSWGTVQHEH